MTDSICRRVVIPQMSLSLTGVSEADARQIAADLPQAVTRAMAGYPQPTNAPLYQNDRHPDAVTERLAGEIAGRLQAGLGRNGGGS